MSKGLSNSSVNKLVITNVSTYKAIVIGAHREMTELLNSGRRPKEDGTPGWIITFDPEQKCFKQAMIAIVFTSMWLEALMHLLIASKYGVDKFKEYDFKSYEEKLRLLGCTDQSLLDSAERFRKSRKELVHEKAFFDSGEMKTVQAEADNAYKLLSAIDSVFPS